MNSIAEVLINSPSWLSPILVLITLGAFGGMGVMMTMTSRRIARIETVCRERLRHCGETFQRSGEAGIKASDFEHRLERIEDKLDQILLKNGWK